MKEEIRTWITNRKGELKGPHKVGYWVTTCGMLYKRIRVKLTSSKLEFNLNILVTYTL